MCETIEDKAKEIDLKDNIFDFLADKVEISNFENLLEIWKSKPHWKF